MKEMRDKKATADVSVPGDLLKLLGETDTTDEQHI
jgi:hypothetical protein